MPMTRSSASSLALAAALLAPALAGAAPARSGLVNSMTDPEAPIGENLTSGFKLAEGEGGRAVPRVAVIRRRVLEPLERPWSAT